MKLYSVWHVKALINISQDFIHSSNACLPLDVTLKAPWSRDHACLVTVTAPSGSMVPGSRCWLKWAHSQGPLGCDSRVWTGPLVTAHCLSRSLRPPDGETNRPANNSHRMWRKLFHFGPWVKDAALEAYTGRNFTRLVLGPCSDVDEEGLIPHWLCADSNFYTGLREEGLLQF